MKSHSLTPLLGSTGKNPRVFVYDYPALKLQRILSEGTESAYTAIDFSPDGTELATVGSETDFMLSVWDWKNERVIRRAKAFSQEVYTVAFSKSFPGK